MKKSAFHSLYLLPCVILLLVFWGCSAGSHLGGIPDDGKETAGLSIPGALVLPPAAKAGAGSFNLKCGWNKVIFTLPQARKFSLVTMTWQGRTVLLKDAVAPGWTQAQIRYLKGRAWVLLATASTTASFQPGGTYYVYSSKNGMVISFDRPFVTGISPGQGNTGDEVSISGINFGDVQGSSTATFNGTDGGAASSWNNTQIVICVPAGATTGPVVVTVNTQPSNNNIKFVLLKTVGWYTNVSYVTGEPENPMKSMMNRRLGVDAKGKANILTGRQKWQYATEGALYNGGVVGDIDGDGTNEIVLADFANKIYCLKPDGTLKWETDRLSPTGDGFYCTLTIFDIDDDGKLEIMAGSDDNFFYCLNYDGSLRWKYETTGGFDIAFCNIHDVDDDNVVEIISGNWNGEIFCFKPDGTLKWYYKTPTDEYIQAIGSADIDDDGITEIIVNCWDDNVYCFSPDGTVKWKTLLGNDPQGLGIADIDNDGTLEMIVDSNDGQLNCLNSNGTIRWQTYVGQYAYDNNHPILDIDKDGELEIITGGGDDKVVRCLRTDGSIKWTSSSLAAAANAPSYGCADLDNDGYYEILTFDDSGTVYCFEHDGVLKWQLMTSGTLSFSALSIADIDKDGKVEVLIGSSANILYCITSDEGDPLISQVNPSSGMPGNTVTITGTNFGGIKGTVTIHGVQADPTGVTWSDTEITCVVPSAPEGAGTLHVTTIDGRSSNSVSFDIPQ